MLLDLGSSGQIDESMVALTKRRNRLAKRGIEIVPKMRVPERSFCHVV